MEVRINNQKTTLRRLTNNILRYYTENNEAKVWYNEAKAFAKDLQEQYPQYSLFNIVGVISALSPQTSWTLNKVYAKRFLKDKLNATANTTANKNKANKCLEAKTICEVLTILNGNKTKAFYLNILMPNKQTSVTIDRHAIAISLQRPSKTRALSDNEARVSNNQYKALEQAYINAANKLGILPQQLQAITWVNYRELRGLTI